MGPHLTVGHLHESHFAIDECSFSKIRLIFSSFTAVTWGVSWFFFWSAADNVSESNSIISIPPLLNYTHGPSSGCCSSGGNGNIICFPCFTQSRIIIHLSVGFHTNKNKSENQDTDSLWERFDKWHIWGTMNQSVRDEGFFLIKMLAHLKSSII